MINNEQLDQMSNLLLATAFFGNGIGGVLKDGKINVGDFDELPNFFSSISRITDINVKELAKEMQHLDSKNIQLLSAQFAGKFDIPQDNAEAIVEKLLPVALKVADLVVEFL